MSKTLLTAAQEEYSKHKAIEHRAPVGTAANVYRANKESENIVTVNSSHYAPWTCTTPKAHHQQQTIHKCISKTHMPLK